MSLEKGRVVLLIRDQEARENIKTIFELDGYQVDAVSLGTDTQTNASSILTQDTINVMHGAAAVFIDGGIPKQEAADVNALKAILMSPVSDGVGQFIFQANRPQDAIEQLAQTGKLGESVTVLKRPSDIEEIFTALEAGSRRAVRLGLIRPDISTRRAPRPAGGSVRLGPRG